MSKNIIYEFWYDYVKPRYGEKTKLGYMDTGNFIVHVNTDDINKDLAKMLKNKVWQWRHCQNVKTRFDTLCYDLNRPLPKGNTNKIIGVIKDELDQKSWKIFSN